MKQPSLYFLIAMGMLLVFSCKKRTDAPGNPAIDNAHISDITYYAAGGFLESTTRITYNEDHTVDSMIITTYTATNPSVTFRKFDYFSGYYTITQFYANGTIPPSSVAHIDLNPSGTISSVTNSQETITFSYDSKKQLTSYTESWGGGYTDHGVYYAPHSTTYSYVWNGNGNIDSFTTSQWSSMTPYYICDMNRLGQTGDMVRIQQFLEYGRSYINTKNVPYADYNASIYPNHIVPWFGYNYDNDGKIVKAYYLSDTTSFYAYKYY